MSGKIFWIALIGVILLIGCFITVLVPGDILFQSDDLLILSPFWLFLYEWFVFSLVIAFVSWTLALIHTFITR